MHESEPARIAIRPALPGELEWANARYAEVSFQPSSERDFIAVAELDAVRAGLGRLVPIDARSGELGGIYVVPAFRARSLARAMVRFLLEHSPYERLFCVPFAELESFYRGFGFDPPADLSGLPEPIAAKLDWCRVQHAAPVRLLVRDSV